MALTSTFFLFRVALTSVMCGFNKY